MKHTILLAFAMSAAALLALPGCGLFRQSMDENEYGIAVDSLGYDTVAQEREIVLAGRYGTLHLTPGNRRALLNGDVIWLLNAPKLDEDGELRVSRLDVEKVIRPLLDGYVGAKRPVRVVLLDPGHGGKESGAVGSKYKEKDLNLALALKIRSELERRGFEVKMTREDDRQLSLDERGKMAAAVGADVFVSVHHNAVGGKSRATGVETYAVTPAGADSTHDNGGRATGPRPGNAFDPANVNLARNIQSRMNAVTGGPDRGMKFARFRVIVLSECPGALIEAGFISEPAEEEAIGSEERQNKVAWAVAEGIDGFRSLMEDAEEAAAAAE